MMSPVSKPAPSAQLPGATATTSTPLPCSSWSLGRSRTSAPESVRSVARRGMDGESSWLPMTASKLRRLPSRTMPISTSVPAGVLATRAIRSRVLAISRSFKLTITSPASMPAASAAVSGITCSTTTPRADFKPSSSASFAGTSSMCTPSRPRRTAPVSASWSVMNLTVLLGTAKPRPPLTPVGEVMALLMPTSRPSKSTSGPPELPRLMAASVWMKSWYEEVKPCRPKALTMPEVTVWPRS